MASELHRLYCRFRWLAFAAVLLALASCSTNPASQPYSAKRTDSPPTSPPTQSGESDELFRNILPGAWIYQAATVERIEYIFFSDGRFEASKTTLSLKGAESASPKGSWKIDRGRLITSADGVASNTILSANEHELVLTDHDGRRLAFKRKLPIDPLLGELGEQARISEFASLFADMVLTNFDKEYEKLAPSQMPSRKLIAALRSLVGAAFAHERLSEAIIQEHGNQMKPDELREATEWHRSPLGKKVTDLFIAASLPGSEAELEKFIADLRQQPGPPDRVRIIEELDRVCKLSESEVLTQQSMQMAFAMGAIALLPPEKRVPLNKITEQMERERPKLILMMQPLVVGMRLFALRSLSIPELREYLEFKTSDLGKKYTETQNIAYRKAILDAAERYLKSIQWAVEHEQKNRKNVSGA